MKNKKGFTLVELLATVTILGIISTLAVISVTEYIKKARDTTYNDHEKSMKGAASNFLIDHSGYIPNVNEKIVIDVERLIEEKYLTTLKDPKGDHDACDETSYVVVERHTNTTHNLNIDYHMCLQCNGHYTSKACQEISIDGLKRYSKTR